MIRGAAETNTGSDVLLLLPLLNEDSSSPLL